MDRKALELLMAEDVEDDALLTIDMLNQRFDVWCERVQTPEAMREALERKTWDLVISDWQMPVFNALQALTITRERDPDIPFIIVSGTVEEDVAVRAMEIGAHDYIIKDNLTRLNAAVTRELREADIRRELARTAHELTRRAEDLYRSNKELERFAYVAAHDLQEPLRIVASYSELLIRTLKPYLVQVPDAEKLVGFIGEGVDQMERQIQGLLTYSKVIHDEEQELQFVDANEACRAALEQIHPSSTDAGAVIEVKDLPVIKADRTHLVQVFQNLLGNAIKYSRKNVSPEICVSARRHDKDWVFSVQDNGIGIPPEHHDRIFQIFKRLHRREYPGLGIGLAVTKRLVEIHGGRIWVESAAGAGATFCFTVPDQREERTDD